MMIPTGLEGILKIDERIMHGALCFDGTRIPVTVFLDNIAEGMSLDEFLVDYSTVSREQAIAVLEWERAAILAAAGFPKSA